MNKTFESDNTSINQTVGKANARMQTFLAKQKRESQRKPTSFLTSNTDFPYPNCNPRFYNCCRLEVPIMLNLKQHQTISPANSKGFLHQSKAIHLLKRERPLSQEKGSRYSNSNVSRSLGESLSVLLFALADFAP